MANYMFGNSSRVSDRLDAKLHQGYDPSSEFKENSMLYSSVQYGTSSKEPESFWEKIVDAYDNIRNGLEEFYPKTYALFQEGFNRDAPPLPASNLNTLNGDDDNNISGGGFGSPFVLPEGDGFTGRGSGQGAGDGGNVSNIGGPSINITGGNPDDPQTPPDLQAPIVSAAAAVGNENQPVPLSITVVSPTAGSTVSILLGNVPAGAVLSAGVDNGNGTWTLTPAQLIGLTITPPAGFSGPINLSISATASLNGDTETTTGAVPVTINGVAMPPDLDVLPASGNENTAIPLDIDAVLMDNDGSETLSVTIGGVPTGAILSAGVNNGNGTWTLTPGQLVGLSITPANGYSGTINLTVTATSSENATTASVSEPLPVTVNGVATPPNLLADDVTGNENMPIALDITASLNDTDGSETLSILISGVPAGATLSAGINNGNGTWTLTPAQLSGLSLTPPTNWNGDIVLTAIATSSENATTSSVMDDFTVTIIGSTPPPDLTVSAASGNEDTAIGLTISAALGAGSSGTEILSIVIDNVPAGAVLSAGIDNGNGSWTLTPAQLVGLTITPPANSDTDFNLTVMAISTDGADIGVNSEVLHVTVNGVPDAPNLAVLPASGNEGASIALNISSSLVDNDGSEVLSIQISGVPPGAILSAGVNNGGGVWTLTPAQLAGLTITPNGNYAGTINLTVTAIASENSATAQTASGLNVVVTGVADTPILDAHDATGDEGTAIPLDIDAMLSDNDGSETLSITITGVPVGAVLSAGINNGGGSWTVTPAQLAGLTITPAPGSDADFTLTVTATATEGASTAVATDTMNVTVNGSADTPNLLVTGNVTGDEDTAIGLTITASLNDNDGSETLSVFITGFPAGTTFSAGLYAGNGRWSLAPGDLAGLTMTPPDDYSGTINLTVTAVSTEQNGDHAELSDTITVTVDPVADDPSLSVHAVIGNEDAAIALDILASLNDPSEVLTVTISGVPLTATLSAGTNLGGGVWSLTAAQLVGLTITGVHNSDADFVLSVTAISHESDGSVETETANINVTVSAVADVPTVSASGSVNLVNTHGNITLSGTLTDTDGSESLTYVITGVPDGFALNQGYNNGDNSWTLTPSQLAGLELIAPLDFEGRVHLRAYSVAHDGDHSSVRSLADNFSVAFGNPLTLEINLFLGIGVAGIGLGVGVGIGLNLGSLSDDMTVMEGSTVTLSDAPGLITSILGLVSYLEFANVPADVTFNHGYLQSPGVWRFNNASDLNNLTMTIPEDSSSDFTLIFRARLITLVTLVLATPDIHVVGVADLPSLSVAPASGNEDSVGIPISISAVLNDATDEVLSVVIKDLPPGFVPNVGIDNGDGSWTIPLANLGSLALIPPAHWSGDATFTVVAIATELEGDSSINTATGTIHVSPVADAPIISALMQNGTEDTPLALNLGVSLADADGSESIIAVTLSGLPAGASLLNATDNGNGTWSVSPAQINNVSFVPPSHWNGDAFISISVTSRESVGGAQATNTANIPVHIEANADDPNISAQNVSGDWDNPIGLNVSASLSDNDGSEMLSVVISGVPDDFVLSAGLNNGDGSWTLEQSELAGLSIEASDGYAAGDITLNMTVYAVETSNQDVASVSQSFTVHGT